MRIALSGSNARKDGTLKMRSTIVWFVGLFLASEAGFSYSLVSLNTCVPMRIDKPQHFSRQSMRKWCIGILDPAFNEKSQPRSPR